MGCEFALRLSRGTDGATLSEEAIHDSKARVEVPIVVHVDAPDVVACDISLSAPAGIFTHLAVATPDRREFDLCMIATEGNNATQSNAARCPSVQ